jgi:hypothetical protein
MARPHLSVTPKQLRPTTSHQPSRRLSKPLRWSTASVLLGLILVSTSGFQAQVKSVKFDSGQEGVKISAKDDSTSITEKSDSSLFKRVVLSTVRWITARFSTRPSSKRARINGARVIYLHPAATSDEGVLEVIQIESGGQAVTLGQSFQATDGWLREIKIKLRNISTKPITYINFGGGLIRGIDEELKPSESFRYGIAWDFGGRSNSMTVKERADFKSVQPGEIVELSYENVGRNYKATLEGEREGFRKLILGTTVVEFEDGEINADATLKAGAPVNSESPPKYSSRRLNQRPR